MERATCPLNDGPEPLVLTADSAAPPSLSKDLHADGSLGLGAFDSDFLAPGDMELQINALEEEPLQLNSCGVVSHRDGRGSGQTDDLEMNFLSDLLQDNDELPVASSGSPIESVSSDSATSSLPETKKRDATGRQKRAKDRSTSSQSSSSSSPAAEPEERRITDRKARRRAQVASSARRLRCRKKYEVMTLKTEANFLEKQLESLRAKHKQTRANNAVAAWEEKAIAQRHKRRQSEKMNEQLRQALFVQSGFVRNLRSLFSEAMPCSIELNMRNFLHTPTRLLNDPAARFQSLERACTNAKLDLAKQIILEETGGITAFTSPQISCRQIDLGSGGFGMTTVAVYALETKNACANFQTICSAILNCGAVWPNYSLLSSSLKLADIPPTKLHIRYGISRQIYQSDATGEQISTESREISYYRLTDNCGVFLWDYVDADDEHPLQSDTAAMRCTIGAVLVQLENCTDGVERIVCRNICTKVHLVDSPEVTPTLMQFSKSRQLGAQICGSIVYETIKSGTRTQ